MRFYVQRYSLRCCASFACVWELFAYRPLRELRVISRDARLVDKVPKSGTFWAGKVYRAGCGFTEQSRARLFITGNHYNPYFGPRVGITAHFSLEYEDPEGTPMKNDFELVTILNITFLTYNFLIHIFLTYTFLLTLYFVILYFLILN